MQAITLLGMSGVGKTTLSDKLPKEKWFHYSADYRIATHYLDDYIGDFLKIEAMKSPLIAQLLKSDSVYIGSNLSTTNLAPVSVYMGKLGNPKLSGLDLNTFLDRQRKHYKAEVSATYDIGYFKEKSQKLYGYQHFVHDAGGSICELDDNDVIAYMAKQTKIIYIHANESLIETVTQRALDYPKPLYYHEAFLLAQLKYYGEQSGIRQIENIIPDEFIRFVIPNLMKHRQDRYLALAEKYGIVVDADDIFKVRDEKDFLQLIENN